MLSLSETLEAYSVTGSKKASSGAMRLLILAFLAGLEVAVAGYISTIGSFAVSNVSLAKLISGLLFPTGLIMVVLTGTELFTGNCLITISVLDKRTGPGGMLRNWLFVYAGNFAGGLALACIVVFCRQLGLGQDALAAAFIRTAASKCSLGAADAFFKGVLCNIMVCAGVFCAVSAKDTAGKVFGSFFPVMAFVIMGGEHCIANMFYVPAGLLASSVPAYASAAEALGTDLSSLSWSAFFIRNLLPVTLGNIAGGCGFAWVMHYAHAAKSKKSAK